MDCSWIYRNVDEDLMDFHGFIMDWMDLITIMDLMDLPMLINQLIIHGISGLEHEWIMTFHSVGKNHRYI